MPQIEAKVNVNFRLGANWAKVSVNTLGANWAKVSVNTLLDCHTGSTTTSEEQMQRVISNLGIMQLVRAGEPTGAGQLVLYSGETFEGEKFRKFCGFVAIRKSFLCKIWGVASFGIAKASNLRKFSPRKSYFSTIHESFLPRKFPAIQHVQVNQQEPVRYTAVTTRVQHLGQLLRAEEKMWNYM